MSAFPVSACAACPSVTMGHSVDRGLIQLLPTDYYLGGAALAVGISFLILVAIPASWSGWLFRRRIPLPRLHSAIVPPLQWLAFLSFVCLVAAGFMGPRDPLGNPLPLFVWTIWWIGFTVIVAIVGDLWPALNPWSAPVRLLRRTADSENFDPPRWLGHAPALIGLAAVLWFDLIYTAPRDPEHVAWAVLAYWLFHLIAMLIFGEAWRERCETFSVAFRLIGLSAPLGGGSLRFPGARLAEAPALPYTGWMFATALIAGITADGMLSTFAWLDLVGVNPLSHPGRTTMVEINQFGLLATWTAMLSAFAFAVWLGWRLAGRREDMGVCLGRLALSLLPIAVAYHAAHFLTHFMINGQYALVALSDPLGIGTNWLGLGPHFVTTSFQNSLAQIELFWQIRVGLIVGGHLLAVLVAHVIALDIYRGRRAAALGGAPLAVLMVCYTVLGLWLLSTPTGA